MASLPEHLSKAPVGRDPISRDFVESHQRDRVLDAATRVFAKRGYQSTTIDHIVAAAKIGVGSFYEFFENKEDCLVQAYDRIVRAAREQIAAEIPAEGPWPEQAAATLGVLLDIIAADPASARLGLIVIQTGGSRGTARYEATLESVVPLLRRGREAGPLGAELPPSLEQAIVGGLAWFLQQRLEDSALDPAELFPELIRLVLEPYLGEQAAGELIAARAATPA